MNPATGAPPIIGQIIITCDAAMNVTFQAKVPSRNVAIMMCERASRDLDDNLKRQEQEAVSQVIETPPSSFDPRKVPAGDKLRIAV